MNIAQVKKMYGQLLCLVGNIDLGYTLTRGTPAEVDAEVRERIEDCRGRWRVHNQLGYDHNGLLQAREHHGHGRSRPQVRLPIPIDSQYA